MRRIRCGEEKDDPGTMVYNDEKNYEND